MTKCNATRYFSRANAISIYILFAASFLPLEVLAETAFIQTRSASLQAEPKLLSKSLKKLSYGEGVDIVSGTDSWTKVTSTGKSGYIHNSALSARKLTLTGKSAAAGKVDETDIGLAGKGFSPEVERQLAASNGSLNFGAVDAMERVSISAEQTKSFIKSGKLNHDSL